MSVLNVGREVRISTSHGPGTTTLTGTIIGWCAYGLELFEAGTHPVFIPWFNIKYIRPANDGT